jgi:bifunctional non-homologous end joining protein LigD
MTRDREDLPLFLEPMLCATGPASDGPDTVVQLKWDGLRGQLRSSARSRWSVRSRTGREHTAHFPELAALAQVLAGHAVLLDGELVVLDQTGRPDFAAVRQRLTRGPRPGVAASMVIFDLLHLDGQPVRELPLRKRLQLLDELLPARGEGWQIAQALAGPIEEILTVVASQELEGVVCKRLASRWQPGRRSSVWTKQKVRRRRRMQVAAWRPAHDQEPELFYLAHPGGRPAGQVSFGLAHSERERLRAAVLARAGERRYRGLYRLSPGITVEVDAHGSDSQPLRDPILRSWASTNEPTRA